MNEAERLADAIQACFKDDFIDAAAAELRRLSAELAAIKAAMGEPVAWMWKNKKTDAEGVYLEDPATIGIQLDHPAYEWKKLYTHPAQQALTTCNCRWDGETQVQQCTLHEAHVDAIHEWAERAKTAEAKLLAPQAKPQPLTSDQKWDMWTAATIEQPSARGCYFRGVEDAEHAHGITKE